MDQLDNIVFTDNVWYIYSKETNYVKKAGSPTLVSRILNIVIILKEVQIKSKKVGPSTLVNIIIIMIMRIVKNFISGHL